MSPSGLFRRRVRTKLWGGGATHRPLPPASGSRRQQEIGTIGTNFRERAYLGELRPSRARPQPDRPREPNRATYYWPDNIHDLTVSPDGNYVWATLPIQAIEISRIWGHLDDPHEASRRVSALNPKQPTEIAYFNSADVAPPGQATVLDHVRGHLHYAAATGTIWFASAVGGFYVVRVEDQVRSQLGLTPRIQPAPASTPTTARWARTPIGRAPEGYGRGRWAPSRGGGSAWWPRRPRSPDPPGPPTSPR